MRDPDRDRPAGRGGKARERLNMFQEARGINEDADAQTYTAAVLQAIAAAAAVPAGANLPQWRLVGPDFVNGGQTFGLMPDGQTEATVPVSGRVGAVAVDPSNANHVLCGSAAGGVWESFTRGASWAPRTDSMPTLTIGAIAFDPGNSRTVYAGTGEGNHFWFLGQGLLRSTDGGATWALRAANPFTGQGFYQIIVDPASSAHILAATTGGVYESNDSGATWAQVYAGKAWDLSMQPGGGPAAEVLAGTDTGLQASADGGHTWNAVALPGAPQAWERLAVSIAPSGPATAYAFGAATGDGAAPQLWWRDGGAWTAIAPMPVPPAGLDLGVAQAGYDWCLAAARDRVDQVYIGIFDLWRAERTAGNWNWTNLSSKRPGDSIHPDQHTVVFDPADPATIYCGCDGGLFRSPDRGQSWVSLNAGLAIGEVEYLAQDDNSTRWLLAGMQDTGTLIYTGTTAFNSVGTGDGGDCGNDQRTPGTRYHSYSKMGLASSADNGQNFNDISREDMGVPDPYQALFYPPMGVAGTTVVQAGQSMFISGDSGANWGEHALSNPAPANTTALYLTDSDHIYAATSDGRVFTLTRANGQWGAATELVSPRPAYISAIRVDQLNRIWVTMSQANGSLVYRSDDDGETWIDKTGALPALPVNSIAFDNANAARVWVSADIGVYQSVDNGDTWTVFSQNLPNALVTDLEFHPVARILRAATRNRGVWEVAVDQPGNSQLPLGSQACALATNHSSGLQAWAVGTGNAPQQIFQNAPNSGWIGWMPVGTVTGTSTGQVITSALAVAAHRDRRLEVFGRGPDGALWHDHTTAPDYGWAGWSSLGGFVTGIPVVAVNQDDRLEVFARGADGTLRHISQTAQGANSPWSAWGSLGAVITSGPAVAPNSDGRLEVFARGMDGTLGHSSQTARGGANWSPWAALGAGTVITSKPAAAAYSDGRLEVLARGTDGALLSFPQSAAGSWAGSAWQPLGGATIGDPAVALTQDGRLAVFARRTDGTVWTITQSAAGSWAGSAWQSLGGNLISDPAVTVNQDGRLEVFAQGADNTLWHVWQTAPNGAWSAWQALGGQAAPAGSQAWQPAGGALTAFPTS